MDLGKRNTGAFHGIKWVNKKWIAISLNLLEISFSFHELGVYDTPAIIDHMLNVTNQRKLIYIGFSQGTTSFLTFASTRPEYNEKLLDVHLLAPVSTLKNIRKPMYKTLARFYTPLKRLLKIFRLYKITLDGSALSLLSKIMKILCKHEDNPTNICKFSIDAILGPCHINAVSSISIEIFFSWINFDDFFFGNSRQYSPKFWHTPHLEHRLMILSITVKWYVIKNFANLILIANE